MTFVGLLPLLLSAAGLLYTLLAWQTVALFSHAPLAPETLPEPVTLLKPLHGAEPRLAENLATFFHQRWAAPLEMVAGVGRADDPAADVARSLAGDVRLVVDGRRHGANAKIGNLVNMEGAASHDLLVLSDSDMAVPDDYLPIVAAALARPGVGAVTCLYRGRGDAGGWSTLGAAAISYHFLPSVLVGLRLGKARPCMGSTIALRRETLARLGGFRRFADILADDYAIGEAVRDLGLTVAVPRLVITHGCAERSLGALLRHELRWAATVRQLDFGGHAGMVTTFPVPFALLAMTWLPLPGAAALLAGLVARWALARAVDRLAGARSASPWIMPLRDCLSLVVFLLSFLVGSVEWRGSRLAMRRNGRITAEARP